MTDDDWMNPQTASSFAHRAPHPDDPKEYLIERERRIICFGNPGSITRWDYWAKYDTAEERDGALQRIHQQHPSWHVRKRDSHPYYDKFGC